MYNIEMNDRHLFEYFRIKYAKVAFCSSICIYVYLYMDRNRRIILFRHFLTKYNILRMDSLYGYSQCLCKPYHLIYRIYGDLTIVPSKHSHRL